MRRLKSILLASTLLVSTAVAARAEINVVASIKPVHSLVAAVMEGVTEPGLIIDGAGSPHNWALKPSQARMLESATVIFWIGHEIEAFLEKPLKTVGESAKSVALIDAHDLIKLGFREGGAFDAHEHDDDHVDDHDDDDDHDHDHGQTDTSAHGDRHHDSKETAAHDHGHAGDDHNSDKTNKTGHSEHDHDHSEAEAGHDDHDAHKGHGKFDAHIWLDPVNAKRIVHEIEEVLVEADPSNAAKYEANARAAMMKLDALISEVSTTLRPVHDKGFIVFHDAYQYFENRFDVSASGSITISPDVMPGAERIKEIRRRVNELGATCVFAEPQFEPTLVSTVMEGTRAKSGILDPLGSAIDRGPDQYFQLIRNMAASIRTCLSESS